MTFLRLQAYINDWDMELCDVLVRVDHVTSIVSKPYKEDDLASELGTMGKRYAFHITGKSTLKLLSYLNIH